MEGGSIETWYMGRAKIRTISMLEESYTEEGENDEEGVPWGNREEDNLIDWSCRRGTRTDMEVCCLRRGSLFPSGGRPIDQQFAAPPYNGAKIKSRSAPISSMGYKHLDGGQTRQVFRLGGIGHESDPEYRKRQQLGLNVKADSGQAERKAAP